MRRIGSVFAATVVVALTAAVAAAAAGQAQPESRAVAIGTGGAVASMDLYASQAGIDVLKRGGNAVDAAVATGSAMGVSVPFVAGPGGGGFMVIYLAKSHQVVTLDGREACPAACTPTMFVDPKTGQPLDYVVASDQPLSTGVPAMVALWEEAVGLYGRARLAADLRPAISLARGGFRINQDFRQLTQSGISTLRAYTASRCRSGTCSRTRTWRRRTSCWPSTAPPTSTTDRLVRPSCRPTTIPCSIPARPRSRCRAS